MAVPVNIRWAPYATYDEVKLENKFSPMQIAIPLDTSHEEALKKIKPITGKMRREFTATYATYALALCIGYVMPAWLAKINGDTLTKPMTLAFSNIPGILKRIHFRDTETLGQITTFICAGRCGISICLMSYCDQI